MDSREEIWRTLLANYDHRIRAYLRRIPCSTDEKDQIVWDVWGLAVLHETELQADDAWPVIAELTRQACRPYLRRWRYERFGGGVQIRLADVQAPDATSTDEFRCACVAAAMEKLTAHQRWAVEYRYRWGWPYWAVAAALECTSATARVHSHNGLVRLRAISSRLMATADLDDGVEV
jgi:DNA-directed RNA polymerase specialized sigma24 family protein